MEYELALPKCGMCKHPDHLIYEAKIASHDITMRKSSEEMQIDVATVSRHMSRCVPKRIGAVMKPEPTEVEGLNVVNTLMGVHQDVRDIFMRSIEAGDDRTALKALETELKQLSLLAKVTGQLSEGPASQINLMMNPDFVQLKQTIFNTLDSGERSKLSAKLLAAADAADIADIADMVNEEVLE
jgi:hypothetical protein